MKVPFNMGAVNMRGKQVLKRVTTIEALRIAGMESPKADAFLEEGLAWIQFLATAVHEEFNPESDAEDAIRDWQRRGRREFGDQVLGRAMRQSGLSNDEAMLGIRSGQFDPFVDTGS
jgi:hypothetical protein